MSKWVWLGLFLLTVAAIGWLGTGSQVSPKSSPSPTTTGTPLGYEGVETEVSPVPQIPMTPSLIMPPEPSPYVDVPPNEPGIIDHPDYVPPPIYDSGISDPAETNFPPPPQAYPPDANTTPIPFEENNEPIPQYLQPPLGSEDGFMDALPPPDEE